MKFLRKSNANEKVLNVAQAVYNHSTTLYSEFHATLVSLAG